MFYIDSAVRIKNCTGEKSHGLLNVPQIFKPLTTELLTLSAVILLSLLEINLKKIGEMTIFEFPISQ